MNLNEIIRMALEQRATDVHLEPSLPVILRVNSALRRTSAVLSGDALHGIASQLLPDQEWDQFQNRGSYDLTKLIGGVQCRINILKTDRGVGLAIRLLSTATNTLRSGNLHPSLRDFLDRDSGLILLSGPTGSGKSTTLAAMLEEINQSSTRHIITLESPIEYRLQPKRSMIRQREVGLHTPSYEQGLMDCLREDPDVIVVGEMRDAESMRWTLNAAETGHLVIATMHSSNATDAIYRIMMSFPPERQTTVLSQLADSVIAIISQKMTYRNDPGILVPALEILVGTYATKNSIRKGEVSKFQSLLQSGGPEGNFTFERYEEWLNNKTDWVLPELPPLSAVDDFASTSPSDREFTEDVVPTPAPAKTPSPSGRPSPYAPRSHAPNKRTHRVAPSTTVNSESTRAETTAGKGKTSAMKVHKDGRIEIPDLDLDLNELIREFKGRGDDENS